jgi:AbiV family abortive infection protein
LLKDKKGSWVENLEVEEKLWIQIMQETLNGINALLDSVKTLLTNAGNASICGGLYMYAVEEYGKLLLLKMYKPSGGKVRIKYRDEFRSHKAKFGVALKVLPKECITLHEGAFDSRVFDPDAFDTDQIADCETRQAVFYSDFIASGNYVKANPAIDEDKLKIAVEKLLDISNQVKIP